MRTERDIIALRDTMRMLRDNSRDWRIEFCVSCMGMAKDECVKNNHIVVIETPRSEGLREWIRCLNWVLGEDVG